VICRHGAAGRTTLAGEGLQHQDGHSHVVSATIPNCVSYDPTFAYELAVIVQDGLRRMYRDQENIFYYITVMNDNYVHPALPKGAEEGIIKGMYLLKGGGKRRKKVQLMGSGAILNEVIEAGKLLDKDWSVDADIWSVTSFSELSREATDVDRWNMLHPLKDARVSYIEKTLKDRRGPVVAATDYIRAFPDQIRKWVPCNYHVLGTDGFGRSDTRVQLRKHFEVNAHYIVIAALKALSDEGDFPAGKVEEAIQKYGIDADKPNPITL